MIDAALTLVSNAGRESSSRKGPVTGTSARVPVPAAEGQHVVAFEADGYDEHTRSGWSVLVNGRVHAVHEEAEIQRLSHLGLRPWVSAADRPLWIRIHPASISGRRTPDLEAGQER